MADPAEYGDGCVLNTCVRLDMSRMIGLSRAQRCGKMVVPSLIPGLMLGVRVAASLAVIITLLVDIFGAGAGLGRLLVESQQRFDAAAAWGLLLIVGLFGYLMSLVLSSLERRIAVGGLRVEVAHQRA
jgi:ABC-type nitrate/sulfonate/bicarbonate transport system permease component